MNYFGINLGHDSSLVGFNEEGELFFYAQSERYGPRIKNDENIRNVFRSFPNLEIKKDDMVVVCSCFNKENNSSLISNYNELLIREASPTYAIDRIGNKNLVPKIVLDHHLAHAFASWCFRENDKEKLFLIYDGCGPWADDKKPYKSSLAGIINDKSFEIIENFEKIPSSMPFNHLLGKRTAGKLMGLCGYLGNFSNLTHEEFMNWINLTADSNFENHRIFPTNKNPNKEDLIMFSKIYYHQINLIWEKIKNNINKFSSNREILVGGGTSLALEINTKIFNMKKNLTFCPATDDSGLALGAAAFAYFYSKRKWPNKINNPNLNNLNKKQNKNGCQEPKEIAQLLYKNKTLGIIRDKSEAGPRALGFRSILAQATEYNNLVNVSQKLKQREYFRPLAPIITTESFDQYFIGPKGKYMQFKCACNQNCKKFLPAIVHKDGSSRPQVVNKEEDPWLHEVLVEYGKLSGHECLINTSLNAKDKPICNTLEDAKADFHNKDIELISINHSNKTFL